MLQQHATTLIPKKHSSRVGTSSICPPGWLGSCHAAQKKTHVFEEEPTAVSYSASVLTSAAVPPMAISCVLEMGNLGLARGDTRPDGEYFQRGVMPKTVQ